MEDDSSLILPLLQENSTALRSATTNVNNSRKSTSTTINEFSTVSNKTLQALLQFYFLDFELMGYKFDPVNFRASCVIETEQGEFCC